MKFGYERLMVDFSRCHYRYNPLARDNCLLCDRPVQMLDYYADIEPDRDYDIYSMADDRQICAKTPNYRKDNARKSWP